MEVDMTLYIMGHLSIMLNVNWCQLLIAECFVNYNFQQTNYSPISTVEAIGQSLSVISMKHVSICKKEQNFLFVSVELFDWQPIFLSNVRVGADAWSLMYPSIPDKLRSLYEDGYKLVRIFFVVHISYWSLYIILVILDIVTFLFV